MKFSIERDKLLSALQKVSGVVERKSSQPILSHVFLHISSHQLRVTGTDLEVEICSILTLSEPAESGEITLPARKLLEICRALPEKSTLTIKMKNEKVIVTSGKSRFSLATLPVETFPKLELHGKELEFDLDSTLLADMLHRTFFAVAQQDVRFYLNGLLMQIKDGALSAVATDGHRLSVFNTELQGNAPDYDIIIPRKAVGELMRLIDGSEEDLNVHVTNKNIAIYAKDFVFVSKLIEGKFPDYHAVLPKESKINIAMDRDEIKNALTRVSILSNEKYKGVNFQLKTASLYLTSRNPDQEEAEEEIQIDYQGDQFDIGFNVSYLLDVLNHIPAGQVEFIFVDSSNSVLIKSSEDEYNCLFVVMPMRI